MQMSFDFFNNEAVLPDFPTDNLKPEEMTLSMFLSDPNWRAFPDPRATGETKGMYKLQTPEGKAWGGGWIGKHRSEEAAKRTFHKNQVKYAIHAGREVSEIVLSEYPAFLKAQRAINRNMSRIHLYDDGPFVGVDVGDRIAHFHLHDFPIYSRVSVRGFVVAMQLLEGPRRNNDIDWFDPLEEMCIALERRLTDILPDDFRAKWANPSYCSLQEGDRIRFRLPTDIQQGNCLEYVEHEGVIVFNLFNDYEVVQYEENGELIKRPLFPSMFISFFEQSHG